MELKVGMWVLTTDRKEIGRITHFCECEYCKERGYLEPIIDNPNIFITIYDKEYGFHGYKFYDNAIDFIQPGDYVNGYKVINVCNGEYHPSGKFVDIDCDKPSNESYFFEEDIKSLVTKEQFADMQYEVK